MFKSGTLALVPLRDIFQHLGFHDYLLRLKTVAAEWDKTGFIKTAEDEVLLHVDEHRDPLESVDMPGSCVNMLETSLASFEVYDYLDTEEDDMEYDESY